MVIAIQKVQDSFGEIRKEGQAGKVAAALAEMAENIHASHVLSLAKGLPGTGCVRHAAEEH
jgi:hypothetical protein